MIKMGYVVKMPQMGMSMEEGEVIEWVVDEDEEVAEEDVIVIVESEKASNEVQAREAGSIRQILVDEGCVVEPGDPIGILTEPDEDISKFEEQIDSDTSNQTKPDTTADSDSQNDDSSSDSDSDVTEDIRASPGARQLADEENIDLTKVKGTGPGGVITEDDIEIVQENDTGNTGSTASTESQPATQTIADSNQLSGVQQTISDRLSESYRNAVHVTINRKFKTDTLEDSLSSADTLGIDVTLNDILLKAVAETLSEYPSVNALYKDGEHRLIEEINIAVAVDSEDGLITPIVSNVDERSLSEVNEVRQTLRDRVLEEEYTMDDLEGGTFTISNLGMFGVDHFDPIINPPQIAILGIGRMRKGGNMILSLSFDHRVINGADAARFLSTLVEKLKSRESIASYFTDDA